MLHGEVWHLLLPYFLNLPPYTGQNGTHCYKEHIHNNKYNRDAYRCVTHSEQWSHLWYNWKGRGRGDWHYKQHTKMDIRKNCEEADWTRNRMQKCNECNLAWPLHDIDLFLSHVQCGYVTMPNLFITHCSNTALTLLHLSQHVLMMHLHNICIKTFCEALLFSSCYRNLSERST